MDLEEPGCRARFMIRDRDPKFTKAFDEVLADAGLKVITTGIRVPRMNSIKSDGYKPAGTNSWTEP
jgi:putative transposase